MSTILLSDRARELQGSRTLSFAARANALRAQGRDIINLGIGELDFDVPLNVKSAAIRAVTEGHSQSTPVAGLLALRAAIARKLRTDNGLEFTEDQIIVGTGSKQVIFNAMLATLNAGDEVVIPAPYWVSYPEIVRLSGGIPVIVPTLADDGFKIQPHQLARAISRRTKWVVINSPANPTGAVYTRTELVELAKVISTHPNILVLSDDIYERFVYDEPFANIAECAPVLADRTLTVNGVSKSHSMIGWRLGYGAGPSPLISAMSKVQSQVTSGTSSITQWAALEALEGPQDAPQEFIAAFRRRRSVALDCLASIAELPFTAAQGAFYVYPSCRALIGRRTTHGQTLHTDCDVADYLLLTASVASIPGDACGSSPYLRLAYVCDETKLSEAFRRVRQAIRALE
jgi:aspartate aminotransferase